MITRFDTNSTLYDTDLVGVKKFEINSYTANFLKSRIRFWSNYKNGRGK